MILSLEDFDLGDGEIISKINQSLAVAAALEEFHMSTMKSYADMKNSNSLLK